MKVFKCKIWAAIGSLMDHAISTTSTTTKSSSAAMSATPDRALLADIDAAVERSVTGASAAGDDQERHVHEILFLVSNAPGAITFLSRRITARLESPPARSPPSPAAALRALLLVHRLLRAGDRYFEQDLRSLWSSRDLRLDSPLCSTCSFSSASLAGGGGGGGEYAAAATATGACSFLHGYAAYLEERMQWAITQSGNLEPRPAAGDIAGGGGVDPVVIRLAMSQRLLDLAIQLLPDNNTTASPAARSAFGIVLRESFKVYAAFNDGLDALLLAGGGGKAAREVVKKACVQTVELKEFYQNCKRSSSNVKGLDYPVVRVVTSSAMDHLLLTAPPPPPVVVVNDESTAADESDQPFATKLETTISTVWVEFDDGGGDDSFKAVQPSYL
uniref:ENTH domain-containing protein n=1 Tax=Leersia perrieri TaxID=77586 RepID=A0A0D9XQR8_9ORYZ